MYQKYFGFKERPFQLVPNPAYLFLSRSHEEAMAHLSYAVSQGDGFIAIIGEVGTGKTTLCRAFIDSMEASGEIAYIFNPKLSAVELLESVCDEFAIPIRGAKTTKALIDLLNRFFLEKKAAGRQVMLIIDEAQNLSREVLEQIRLLSNLETDTEKLIQIVLVGQPELDDMLAEKKLRQLSQRISLSCRLAPLTLQETEHYIQHRIRIAARKNGIAFTASAYRKIHAYSQGIPRRIHIVCDRALLVAYVANREKISGDVVNHAILELTPREGLSRFRKIEKRKTILLGALLGLAVGVLLMILPMNSGTSPVMDSLKRFKLPSADPARTPQSSVEKTPAPSATTPVETSRHPEPTTGISETAPKAEAPSGDLAVFLAGIDPTASKENALSAAISLWKRDLPIRQYADKRLVDPGTYFNLTARENGFLLHESRTGLQEIYTLNLPAIFEFMQSGKSEPVFLALSRATDTALTFLESAAGSDINAPIDEVKRLWTGTAYIPWNNFYAYEGVIPISGSGMDIAILKEILIKIGFTGLTPGPAWDAATESAVRETQEKHGIPGDGLAGPMTKIILYNELPGQEIPHILESARTPAATER